MKLVTLRNCQYHPPLRWSTSCGFACLPPVCGLFFSFCNFTRFFHFIFMAKLFLYIALIHDQFKMPTFALDIRFLHILTVSPRSFWHFIIIPTENINLLLSVYFSLKKYFWCAQNFSYEVWIPTKFTMKFLYHLPFLWCIDMHLKCD